MPDVTPQLYDMVGGTDGPGVPDPDTDKLGRRGPTTAGEAPPLGPSRPRLVLATEYMSLVLLAYCICMKPPWSGAGEPSPPPAPYSAVLSRRAPPVSVSPSTAEAAAPLPANVLLADCALALVPDPDGSLLNALFPVGELSWGASCDLRSSVLLAAGVAGGEFVLGNSAASSGANQACLHTSHMLMRSLGSTRKHAPNSATSCGDRRRGHRQGLEGAEDCHRGLSGAHSSWCRASGCVASTNALNMASETRAEWNGLSPVHRVNSIMPRLHTSVGKGS